MVCPRVNLRNTVILKSLIFNSYQCLIFVVVALWLWAEISLSLVSFILCLGFQGEQGYNRPDFLSPRICLCSRLTTHTINKGVSWDCWVMCHWHEGLVVSRAGEEGPASHPRRPCWGICCLSLILTPTAPRNYLLSFRVIARFLVRVFLCVAKNLLTLVTPGDGCAGPMCCLLPF